MLRSPDWFAIVTELIYLGVPMKEVARRMDAQLTESMLRYYRSGGEPLYVRGEALLKFWSEKTGKPVADAPRRQYTRGHRVEQSEQVLRSRCFKCGQIMRGNILEKWTQLQVHYDEFGGPAPCETGEG